MQYVKDVWAFHRKHWKTEVCLHLAMLFLAWLINVTAEESAEKLNENENKEES